MRSPIVIALVLAACGSQVGSVGAVLGRDNETHALYVREVPPGLGAAKAGLLPGDEIIMIDGYYVRDLGEKNIRALLRGDIGSSVELTIVRGSRVEHVQVKRTAYGHQVVQPKEEKMED